ncbi:MAG: hypothetical protein ACRC35_06285 [Angustibacter sp.]
MTYGATRSTTDAASRSGSPGGSATLAATITADPSDDHNRLDVPSGSRRLITGLRQVVVACWRWFDDQPVWAQLLMLWVASRAVCAVVVQFAAAVVQNPAGVGAVHPHYGNMVVIWDGVWYQQIAEEGYPAGLPLAVDLAADYNAWAFFPFFPYLVRAVMLVGLPFPVAATLVNLVAGYGAAVVLHRLIGLTTAPGTRRLPMVAVAVWCLAPAAPVLQIAYTEAVAALLLGGVLLLLLQRHYLAAVPCVLLLGLTRAVAAPLLLVIAWHGIARWRSRADDRFDWRQRVGLGLLSAATVASAALWPVIAGVVTGIPDAFLQTQARWGQRPTDGPFLLWIQWAWRGAGIAGVAALLGVVATGIHLVLGRHGRWLPAELRVWTIGYPLYLLAVTYPITSTWRFLLLNLPLAAVVGSLMVHGSWVRRFTLPTRVWLLAAGCLIGLAWWTSTLLTRIPWADSPP